MFRRLPAAFEKNCHLIPLILAQNNGSRSQRTKNYGIVGVVAAKDVETPFKSDLFSSNPFFSLYLGKKASNVASEPSAKVGRLGGLVNFIIPPLFNLKSPYASAEETELADSPTFERFEGSPDSLEGITIVITGELASMTR
jgi:hypothetical protein